MLEPRQNNRKLESVVAIVPAYNEDPKKVEAVLTVLTNVPVLDEVILVDDGSMRTDMRRVANLFSRVRYFRNEPNRGKAFSMDRGVKEARASIIFFCDSDLRGLTPQIVEGIIRPVLDGTYDMFIGVRSNLMQRSYVPFALNSGERALRREYWEQLPQFYKYRFRIEAGLNAFVATKSKRGFGYAVFSYGQTLKEQKYGFWRGSFHRWWMNRDVVFAWFYAWVFHHYRVGAILNPFLSREGSIPSSRARNASRSDGK